MKQADLDRNEIIEMVRIAEDKVIANPNLDWKIEFAKLVAKKAVEREREACIQIVENEAYQYSAPVWAFEIVNAIKDRGEQHE